MMSRLKSGLSRERWEREPELCQVCIHTHHVSEWAFYITLNLDQMAYTQWAAVHGYWDIVMCTCVHESEHTACGSACHSLYVSVCLTYLLYCMCEQWHASFVLLCLCLRLCLFLSVCECVCTRVRESVALWAVDAVLLHWQRARFSPSQSLSGFQLLTAAGQQPAALIAQYEMHISCLLSLHLIISYSIWFMLSINDRRKWISRWCRMPLWVGKGEGCLTENLFKVLSFISSFSTCFTDLLRVIK